MSELAEFSKMVMASGLAPKSFRHPSAIALVCIQGSELGLTACTSLQGLISINGTIGFRSKFLAQLVIGSPVCEIWKVLESQNAEMVGRVEVKRRGWSEAQIVTYTMEDAKTAGLWAGSDVWKKHPRDMLIARAITRAATRHFPDVLGGVQVETELLDATAPPPPPPPPSVTTKAAADKGPPKKGAAALREALDMTADSGPPIVNVVRDPKESEEGAPAATGPDAATNALDDGPPSREAAQAQYRSLYARLTELVGVEAAKEKTESITLQKKRSSRGRQKALDELGEIVADIEAAGF
jgi:hypothetical protein